MKKRGIFLLLSVLVLIFVFMQFRSTSNKDEGTVNVNSETEISGKMQRKTENNSEPETKNSSDKEVRGSEIEEHTSDMKPGEVPDENEAETTDIPDVQEQQLEFDSLGTTEEEITGLLNYRDRVEGQEQQNQTIEDEGEEIESIMNAGVELPMDFFE